MIRIDLDKHPINILRRDIQIELDPLTVIQMYLVIYPGIEGILSRCETSDEQDSDTDLSGNWSNFICIRAGHCQWPCLSYFYGRSVLWVFTVKCLAVCGYKMSWF